MGPTNWGWPLLTPAKGRCQRATQERTLGRLWPPRSSHVHDRDLLPTLPFMWTKVRDTTGQQTWGSARLVKRIQSRKAAQWHMQPEQGVSPLPFHFQPESRGRSCSRDERARGCRMRLSVQALWTRVVRRQKRHGGSQTSKSRLLRRLRQETEHRQSENRLKITVRRDHVPRKAWTRPVWPIRVHS